MIEAVTDGYPASIELKPNSTQSADQAQRQYGEDGLPGEVLIVFTSPVDHYISPHFYTAANSAAGASAGKAKVAPTWNYAAVQVYGRMQIYHDSTDKLTGTFLQRQLSDLAVLGEEGIMGFAPADINDNGTNGERGRDGGQGRPSPWKLDHAPAPYITLLKKNIVGMRVEITRVEGRFKVSQDKGDGDRGGVVDGLERRGGEGVRRMAEFVREGHVV
ncbi:Uncharacterized protein F1880_010022 [Penicillium rolfsii]|nr:Uncharacterized protein F1880_010022 [Penicillium rolfsii]